MTWRKTVIPAGGGVVRILVFRRFDGFLELRIGASGKDAGFDLVFNHFAPARNDR